MEVLTIEAPGIEGDVAPAEVEAVEGIEVVIEIHTNPGHPGHPDHPCSKSIRLILTGTYFSATTSPPTQSNYP